MPFQFPGYPAYLAAAARALGLNDPRASDEARCSRSLPRLSDLVAQLGTAPHAGRPDILREATRSRDALALGYQAAEEILAEAHRAFGFDPPPRILAQPRPRPPRPR
jgi:hypothetical protein